MTTTDTRTWPHQLIGDWATVRNLRIVRTADRLISTREVAMCRDGIADIDRVRSLARWIAAAADAVQERLCGDVNHTSMSHRTALEAVEAALHTHPVPWDGAGDVKHDWRDRLVDRAVELAEIAAELEQQHRDYLRER